MSAELSAPPAASPDPRFLFIDLARLGRNTGWSYLRGILWIVLYWFGGSFVLLFAEQIATARYPTIEEPLWSAVLFLSIWALGAGAIHAARRSHRRPALTLIAPDGRFDLRRFFLGAVIWVAIPYTLAVLAIIQDPNLFRWDPTWPFYALGAVLLIPLQAASEEIVFRGYLTQALGQILRNRWLVAVLIAIPFAAIHGNPEGPLSFFTYALMSLGFSALTMRDQRLEMAIGAHTGNNLFVMLLVTRTNELIPAHSLIHVQPKTLGMATIAFQATIILINVGMAFLMIGRLERGDRSSRPRSVSTGGAQPDQAVSP